MLPGGPAEVAVIAAALISTLANGWIQLLNVSGELLECALGMPYWAL
jgi:hypothetical protein